MLYHNKRTGAVIDVDCRISGGDWEAVDAAPPAVVDAAEKPAEPAPEARPRRKGKAAV